MKIFLFSLLVLVVAYSAQAQVKVGNNPTTITPSAMLEVESTTKGLLPPRMTTAQRNAITSPAIGLNIYNTTDNCMQFYTGNWWYNVCTGATEIPGFALTCGGLVASPVTFTALTPYTGTLTVPYTGALGGVYAAGTAIPSTGVTGLTATLQAGTLANGAGNLTLNITGTPSAAGVASFAFSFGGQSCTLIISACGASVNGTFKYFMCHNLGADMTLNPNTYVVGNADGSDGTLGYLYQWGRQTDGHELRNSATTPGPLGAPVANTFITNGGMGSGLDWITPLNHTLWGDGTLGANPAKATNDPCPAGFKVPSYSQWSTMYRLDNSAGDPALATQNVWTWTGNGFTVGTTLYLPAAGFRSVATGGVFSIGSVGNYWSSTRESTFSSSESMSILSSLVNPGAGASRGHGISVRCIAE